MSTTRFVNPSEQAQQISNRFQWLLELMSRFAAEKSESHDSARLAAAIVTHLKALAEDLPSGSRDSDTALHWLELWEPILERQVGLQRRPESGLSASLQALVRRARYA